MATNNSINNAVVANNFSLPNTNGAGTQGEIIFGGNRWISNFGTVNTFVGESTGNTTLTAVNSTGIGAGALFSLTTGVSNSVMGTGSGQFITTGARNSAIGVNSISLLTTGSDNIVLGFTAGNSYVSSESNNIALGNVGTAGESNVLRIGDYGSSTRQQNKSYIAATYSNFGTNNTFVGEASGNITLTGQRNTCLGTTSLVSLTTGTSNSASGYLALNACTTGSNNVAMGQSALSVLTTGTTNTAIGSSVLLALISGVANVGVGTTSLSQITTGSNNTAIGFQSGRNYTSSESDNIAIGYNVGNLSDSNTIRLGAYGSSTGQQNKCFIAAAYSNFGTNNTFVGETTGNATLSGTGNVGVGKTAIQALTTGGNNAIVGFLGGASITTGTNNSGVGVQVLNTLSTGTFNSAVGSVALQALATGSYNVAMGYQSGLAYTGSESSNIVIGSQGVVGESNTIRIGTDGTGTQQQNICYTAGIHVSARSITALTGTISTTNGSVIVSNTDAAATSSDVDFKKARGSGVITSGDVLGTVTFQGHDGSGYVISSQIISTSSGTIASSRVASNLEFFTHPNSTTASTQRMVINSAGNVTVNAPDSGVGLTVTAGGLTVTAGTVTATAGDFSAAAGNLLLPTTNSALTNGVVKINAHTVLNTYDGNASLSNIFVGLDSGSNAASMTSGAVRNSGFGTETFKALTTGDNSAGLGWNSLVKNTTGGKNTGCGSQTLNNITTGSFNTALGYQAGSNLTTGSEANNIHINNVGVNGESNVLRIGSGTGTGTQNVNKAFISGIRGITTGVANAVAVLVDSSDQLGTVSSSIRFKENVHDMGDASSNILKLRPVTFNYKSDSYKTPQYGLIAEEVVDHMPNLVVYDNDGQPETLQYHHFHALLLNELKKQAAVIEKLLQRIDALEK